MLRRLSNITASALVALGLAGCAATAPGGLPAPDATRANVDLAQDFLDLTFRLETGQMLERLLRYEGPVRVSLDPALAAYAGDMADVLATIRRAAGIDIAPGGAESQIRIILVPANELRSAVPGAACFVAPGVRSWAALRSGRPQRWSALTALGDAAIFIPDDAPPYSVRACLHEEIGQALGPVNDLYRLPDSVFNDDNIHLELTGFDLLMLRILYAPELQVGTSREAVAAALPGLLARLNPQGQGRPSMPRGAEPAGWQRALEAALNPRLNDAARANAARTALTLGRQIAPADHRLVLSLMISGRFAMRSDPAAARTLFAEAHALSLAQLGAGNLRSAQTGYHLAATMIADEPDAALALVAQFLPVAARAKDAPLESGLLAIRAISYLRLGRMPEAERARRDSLDRAAYAFGADENTQDPLLGFPTRAATN